MPYFIANWKMNMLAAEACDFTRALTESTRELRDCFIGVAAPFTALDALHEVVEKTHLQLGAQNVHWLDAGPHTGEISPPMLLEHGVQFALCGHSERRLYYGETDEAVSMRATAAIGHRMTAVVCVGETREQYEQKKSWQVVERQLQGSLSGLSGEHCAKLIVAYEPVWAIGTGLAATPEIASNMHARIFGFLEDRFGEGVGGAVPIIYGGSTTPENIGFLMERPHIEGALVGGASLKVGVFTELIKNGYAAKRT